MRLLDIKVMTEERNVYILKINLDHRFYTWNKSWKLRILYKLITVFHSIYKCFILEKKILFYLSYFYVNFKISTPVRGTEHGH